MKRIGIEGSPFFGDRTGIGQYAKRLMEAVSKIDSEFEFEIIRFWLPFKKFIPPIPRTNRFSYRLVRWFPPAVYFQIFKRLGWFIPYDLVALRRYQAVLFFNFVAFPVRKKVRAVSFIHDLSFIHFPQYTQHKNLPYMKRFVPSSIKHSAHVITISESTKRQIVKHYKVNPDKISVVYPAVDQAIFYPRNDKDTLAVRKKYNLPMKYLLYIGTLEPRKNIEGILNAYSALDWTLKQQYPLVLVGGKGWKNEAILKNLDSLRNKGEKILLPGYVPDEDLPAIYSGASLFIFPSFYEGFGIPVLEAMACGTPVITANNTSLPEVVGSAAILVEAEDSASITKQITKILLDPKLANDLRARGLKQAQNFSWDGSAKKLVKLLENL